MRSVILSTTRTWAGLLTAATVFTTCSGDSRPSVNGPPGPREHELLLVPSGAFPMGSAQGSTVNQPVHSVYLESFFIDRYEVTAGQFRSCVDAGECSAAVILDSDGNVLEDCNWGNPEHEEHPINCASWHQATQYCGWVGLRLPTEAEWEKAARSEDERTFPWGEEYGCNRGNFDDDTTRDPFVMPGGEGCDGYLRSAPVGSFPLGASPYGVEDMAGNVSEWVSDVWDRAYYEVSPDRNPTGPPQGSKHVVRGGNWDSGHETLWTWARDWGPSSYRQPIIGFRCASD